MPSKKAMEVAAEWANRYQYPWPNDADRQKEIRMLATLIDEGAKELVFLVELFRKQSIESLTVPGSMTHDGKALVPTVGIEALDDWKVPA